MRKRFWCALAACLLLAGSACASEEFEGQVVAGSTESIVSPFGGTIQSASVRAGQTLAVGDTVCSIETTKVLATEDGTVRGVFAQPGDSAEQAVLYIAPVSKYTLSCSIDKAYASADTKYVRIGETLYIKCAVDGSHQAVGVVTAVSGSDYTVQTTGGELYMEETVYLYRSSSYASKTRVGSGTVSRTPEIAVQGTGSLLKVYVADGDEVERGQLLFETVQGDLDALLVSGSDVQAQRAGVVAEVKAQTGQQVQKGDVLLTVYPWEDYQIEFSVPEESLSSVAEGDAVSIYFNWNEDQQRRYEGTVDSVSYVAKTSDTGEVSYTGYIRFEADESVRLGMNVTVTLGQ